MASVPNVVFDLIHSQNIHRIDQKGNLHPIRLTLDTTYFTLNIEKLDCSSLLASLTAKPLSRSVSTSNSTFLQKNLEVECILLSEIQELRLYEQDSKLCSGLINQQAWMRLHGENRNNLLIKYKKLEILFGLEFNLNHYKFLVGCKLDESLEGSQLKNGVDNWKLRIEHLISYVKSLGYFEKLELWYNKQFGITAETCTNHHRLKIWKQFLHRTHHQISTQSLRTEYDNLERLLVQDAPNFCSGSLEKEEFNVVARYFVHSRNTISNIFGLLSTGYEDKLHLLELLENANDEELDKHQILGSFQSIFNAYFAYTQKFNGIIPEIKGELHGASTFAKAVFRRFAERFQGRNISNVIEEKWMCSYYILDFMYSTENTIWCPFKTQVYQPMNHPISHYYIASSHNTYLTGDQYKSASSVEAYVRCLRQGCRCIEIDVWNGPKNKPIVKHGRTLTTQVKLKDVLNTVRKYAFETTPYPLIISIENHCSLKQQKVMAKYFRQIFGKMLVTSQTHGLEAGMPLPSPADLKNRIILKGRKLPTNIFDKNDLKGENEYYTRTPSFEANGADMDVPGSNRRLSNGIQNPCDDNACDCLITGELYKKNETGNWTTFIFVLTNAKLFYIEKRDMNNANDAGKNNYVRETQRHYLEANQDLHNDQMWFHGEMAGGKAAATKLLERFRIHGSFLVRKRRSVVNEYKLSIYYKDHDAIEDDQSSSVVHCDIYTKMNTEHEKIYSLSQNPTEPEMFPSIFELIEHYKQNPIVTTKCRLERLGSALPLPISHESCEWFYKDIDKNGAEKVLEKLPINGAFLGRYRKNYSGEIVISFRFQNVIKHCHISREGRYLTVSTQKFGKLETLVEYYSRNVFYKNVKLYHPVNKELYALSKETDCVPRVYKSPEYLNATVKTVKGRVRAIQSYTTSDPELLSFRKGDIIVNVIKEPDGWWTGTLKDAVGEEALIPKQFCSSFVEDMEELECPFQSVQGKGTYPLGMGAKLKSCRDKNGKQNGINYYISFKDHDGTKRILGASCSKRKANEWVEMINHVVAKDEKGKQDYAKWLATQKYEIAAELSDLIYLQAVDKFCHGDIDWN